MTYKRMTLGALINELRHLPGGAKVRGLVPYVNSYRGFYERNAIEPDANYEAFAYVVADALEVDIGKPIHGYKGGDYIVDADELVYYAGYGNTGPAIIGLEFDETVNAYVPVLLEEDWRF